jgi:hypothetical protein
MKPGIHFTKVWFDADVVELKIDVSDGVSSFSNRVYVGYSALTDVIAELGVFKDHVHGGLLDIRFGEFGPEYASGAFHARLHFPKPGRLYITSKQQSEFGEFSVTKVASEATLYLKTEPALLDNFIGELRSLEAKKREEAHLESI